MPRIRYLKPEFFSNEHLALCCAHARLAFAGLWCWADRAGRVEDRPLRLKALILPYDDVSFDDLLKQLDAHDFIKRYRVRGRKLIQIINFERHQRPHHREMPSALPPPRQGRAAKRRGQAGAEPGPSRGQDVPGPLGNGERGMGNGERGPPLTPQGGQEGVRPRRRRAARQAALEYDPAAHPARPIPPTTVSDD